MARSILGAAVMKASRCVLLALVALPAVLLAGRALAVGWPFIPTAAEFAQWPLHCRVQYNYVNRGENEFASVYSQGEVDAMREKLGDLTFAGLHHYCAAIIYLRRLPFTHDPTEKKILLLKALDDGQFSYLRSETTSVAYPEVAVTMAQARKANGEVDEAVRILKHAISVQPMRVEAYGALALMHWQKKDRKAAREVLMEADAATEGKSAEVKYNLGLLNIELGDLDAAVANARDAYALKYPLPGLRNKLSAAGRWPPPGTTQ
jgi:tetratricopeptide (TPR) repeat protein